MTGMLCRQKKVMLKRVVQLFGVSAITLALCGCSDRPAIRRTDEKTDSLLEFINGKRFVSTEQFEVGLGENGPEMGHWYLSFHESTLTWDFSDTQLSGTFTIAADGNITASMRSNEVTGSFDRKTKMLMWDGKQYEPAADSDGA